MQCIEFLKKPQKNLNPNYYILLSDYYLNAHQKIQQKNLNFNHFSEFDVERDIQ